MARVLILTPQFPYPPEQGTSLRNLNIIRGISQNNQVGLISFGDQDAAVQQLSELAMCDPIHLVSGNSRTTRHRIGQLLRSSEPDIAHRLRDEGLKIALAEELQDSDRPNEFDIVQVEGLELAYLVPLIRKLNPSVRVLFDAHNAETQLQRRAMVSDLHDWRRWPAAAYSAIQIGRIESFEARVCSSADWVTVVSKSDREHLRKIAPSVPMTVIPNCIDLSEYESAGADSQKIFDVVFTGKMDYRPNVDAVTWFAREIWPRIRNAIPQATWAIVGQRPLKRVEALKRIPGVTVTGRVERVMPYLQGAKVFVMPFRIGSGTRLKLIEAMASGLAIVSTRVGAEGFPVVNNRHLVLADDKKSFSQAIIDLLGSSSRRARLAEIGREFARAYDWQKVTPAFDEIYERLVRSSPRNQ